MGEFTPLVQWPRPRRSDLASEVHEGFPGYGKVRACCRQRLPSVRRRPWSDHTLTPAPHHHGLRDRPAVPRRLRDGPIRHGWQIYRPCGGRPPNCGFENEIDGHSTSAPPEGGYERPFHRQTRVIATSPAKSYQRDRSHSHEPPRPSRATGPGAGLVTHPRNDSAWPVR